MSETVISIENVSKEYRLGVIGTRTLRGDFERWYAKLRGKEDPAVIIGQENKLNQKSDVDYVYALKNINLEVKKGDVLGIVGKNGAGKSTLLKLLSRVTAPTEGMIKIKGRLASLLEVGTGFHPELTGKENVYLNGAILGMTKAEIKNRIAEIVEFSGIEKYIDTPVKRYSSGMYVRLAFAVAAHLDPDIMIVDEVLAVGDADFHKKAMKKMKEVSQGNGRAVLFVSHNMSAIKHLCNSAVLLEQGSIKFSGKTDEVIDKYLQTTISFDSPRDYILSDDKRIRLKMPYWLNHKNEPVKFFSFGETIKLRFELEFLEKFSSFNIGFAVIRSDGQRVFTSHLLDDPEFKNPRVYHGHLTLDTDFNLPSLAPGLYSVSFGLRDENEHTILLSENELSLEIGQINMKNAGYGVLWHTSKWQQS